MQSEQLLRITVETVEDARLIRAAGEVDLSTVHQLHRALDAARDEEHTAVLDLSGVTFIDSTGLQALLEATRSTVVSDWTFFILRPSAAVRRLIELSRTGDILPLAEPAL
jgi:anti-anti-sigma factor